MIESAVVTLAEQSGRRFAAYRVRPDVPRGASVLILHDMFGITAPFRALADDFARAGHCALVPNQFWRADPDGVLPYEGDHAQAWARLGQFDFGRAIEGIGLALAHLRRDAGRKVLALGFCFSGRLAFLAAARTDVDAAASLYALGISRDGGEAPRIACPVQLHYGLADEHVPRAEIDAVAALVAGNPRVELHLYPGAGHSFFNPVRPTYDAAAAALARRRIDALLDRIAR